MFSIILTTAITLHAHNITRLETSKQVAEALRPLAGNFAYWLYTLGLLGVGFLSLPTLTGSAAYALAEIFRWRQGLDEKVNKAWAFYSIIVLSTILAVAVDFSAINPIRALYWTAVVNGVLAPFLLVGIIAVASDAKIMAGQPSSLMNRLVVGLVAAIMFTAAIATFVM
jgi:Mn2+/Fe2+ NRAMP family transporter